MGPFKRQSFRKSTPVIINMMEYMVSECAKCVIRYGEGHDDLLQKCTKGLKIRI